MSKRINILFLSIQTSKGVSGQQERTSQKIEHALQLSSKRDFIQYQFAWVAGMHDLTRALIKNKPNILHLSCGSCSETGLIMLDKQKGELTIEIEDLCELLTSIERTPECVLFDVGQSEQLAQRVSYEGIYSIGMKGPIASDVSQEFWLGFYEYFGDHAFLNIKEAFEQGKKYLWHKDTQNEPLFFRDPLLDHLDGLTTDFTQKVNDSCLVHHMLKHSLVEHPEAVESPLEGLTVNTEFSNLEEAFEKNENRLLLLGEAGSGKTIFLMHYARKKAQDWLKDPEGLFPLWLQLGQWKPTHPLFSWIQEQSGLHDHRFQQLWEARQLLVILDSLDELPTDIPVKESTTLKRTNYQLAFVEAWKKDPFLAEIPCILSSRVNDYETLTQKYKKNLVFLHGAVTLEPLRESSIREYLEHAHIDRGNTLIQALQGDSKLLDLVRRPIFLEIVCDAYQDQELLQTSSENDQDLRFKVINRYLEKNYQPFQYRSVSLNHLKSVMGKAIFHLMSDFHSEDSLLSEDLILEQISDPSQLTAYIQLAIDLHLIEVLPHREKTFRFRHLLIRDFLVGPFALQALQAENPEERIQGIVILGKLGNVHNLDELSLLRDDPSDSVRYELAYTLGRIRTPQAKLILTEYLLDEDPDVRMAAVRALSRYGDLDILGNLIRLIKNSSQDRFVRTEAIEAAMELARQLPPERGGELENLRQELNLLTDRDKFYEIREAAKDALDELGLPSQIPASQYLFDQLSSQDYKKHQDELPQLWIMAVHMLTTFGFDYEEITQRPYLPISSSEIGDLLINSLILALEHPTAPIARQLAAKSLGRLGVEKAVDALNELMRKDEFSFVRIEAQSALKYIYLYPGVSTSTRVKIHQYMTSANLANEITELNLANTSDSDSLVENIRIFQDKRQNDYERLRAALKIADLSRAVDTRSAVKVLSQALSGDHPNVAAAAAVSLGKMGIIDESQREKIISRLIENLDNEDHVLRAQVCIALSKLATDDMIRLDVIVEKFLDLWRNDPISDVRQRAEIGILEIFRQTRHPKAHQALRRLGKLPM